MDYISKVQKFFLKSTHLKESMNEDLKPFLHNLAKNVDLGYGLTTMTLLRWKLVSCPPFIHVPQSLEFCLTTFTFFTWDEAKKPIWHLQYVQSFNHTRLQVEHNIYVVNTHVPHFFLSTYRSSIGASQWIHHPQDRASPYIRRLSPSSEP